MPKMSKHQHHPQRRPDVKTGTPKLPKSNKESVSMQRNFAVYKKDGAKSKSVLISEANLAILKILVPHNGMSEFVNEAIQAYAAQHEKRDLIAKYLKPEAVPPKQPIKVPKYVKKLLILMGDRLLKKDELNEMKAFLDRPEYADMEIDFSKIGTLCKELANASKIFDSEDERAWWAIPILMKKYSYNGPSND